MRYLRALLPLASFIIVAAAAPSAALNTTLEGCYSSAGALTFSNRNIYQTPGYCQEVCVTDGNYTDLATTNSTDCYCGNTLPPKSNKVDNSNCNVACPGYPLDMCGSANAEYYSVYSTGEDNSVGTSYDSVSDRTSSSVSLSSTTATATPSSTPTTFFTYPPPGGQTSPLSENEIWYQGQTKPLRWSTTKSYNYLYLWQQNLTNAPASRNSGLRVSGFVSTTDSQDPYQNHTLEYFVDIINNATESPVFFFALADHESTYSLADNAVSSPINISMDSAPSNSSTGVPSAASTARFGGSTDGQFKAVGLGVCLSIGVPIVLLLTGV